MKRKMDQKAYIRGMCSMCAPGDVPSTVLHPYGSHVRSGPCIFHYYVHTYTYMMIIMSILSINGTFL